MQFSQLWGVELDRELSSADRTQLFTTARRKAAINAGQLEWNKRTECLQRQVSVSLSDGVQEYDIEPLITDFLQIAKQGVSIKIVSGSTTRYIEGDDLEVTTIPALNVEEPGWRAVSAGTPTKLYIRNDGGAVYLGFHPAPDVVSPQVWTALVPCVVIPADMSADADEPFTVSTNVMKAQRPWHRALVHYGAYDMEKFRKDADRMAAQLQLFELEVAKYVAATKPKGGSRVRLARDYRQTSGRMARPLDPRVFP